MFRLFLTRLAAHPKNRCLTENSDVMVDRWETRVFSLWVFFSVTKNSVTCFSFYILNFYTFMLLKCCYWLLLMLLWKWNNTFWFSFCSQCYSLMGKKNNYSMHYLHFSASFNEVEREHGAFLFWSNWVKNNHNSDVRLCGVMWHGKLPSLLPLDKKNWTRKMLLNMESCCPLKFPSY